jgi:uncharacterized coiled-coil DUF342 family protein
MVAADAQPNVLLVGEFGAPIESDLARAGFATASVRSANDAVSRLKNGRIPVVVVPPVLRDMDSVEFIHGVLRHFDASVVLVGAGADPGEVDALVRTGRVAHLPHATGSRPLVEVLSRTLPRTASPAPPAQPLPRLATPLSALLAAPRPNTGTFPVNAGFGVAPSFQAATGPYAPPSFPPTKDLSSYMPPAPVPSPSMFGGSSTPPANLSAMLSNASSFPGSYPPSAAPRPDPTTEELARARNEVASLQQRLRAAETDRAALMAEVDAARRSAMTNVAEVMALSDEGDPISEEIDALKRQAADAEQERDAARYERDQLTAELADVRTGLVEAQAERARQRQQLDDALTRDAAHKARETEFEALMELAAGLSSEVETLRAARDRASVDMEAAQKELETALKSAGRADEWSANLAAARSDATTARLDLQEAMMRLDEAHQLLAAAQRDAQSLRAEAEPLRDWAQQVVARHAAQQHAIEQLRTELAQSQRSSPRIAELERTVDALRGDLDRAKTGGGGSVAGETEVLLARTRQLAGLVGALEPFMWALTQATTFFAKQRLEGSDEHVRLLQQLQGVLLRLRDEIAMLDLG